MKSVDASVVCKNFLKLNKNLSIYDDRNPKNLRKANMKQIIEEILDTKLGHLRMKCPENITDLVFLEIEKSYMHAYEQSVRARGQDTINKFIGKYVREYWVLKNIGRCKNPESNLISSYEMHSNY